MNAALRRSLVAALALALSSGCAVRDVRPSVDAARYARMGSVQLDAVARAVIATGFVNQVEGAIELVICGPGGKRHESIFVMEAHPMDLQAALLLLGAKSGPPMKGLGMGPPRGSLVDIWVEWVDASGHTQTRRAEQFARNWRAGKVLPPKGWVFTGSVVIDGHFKALAEESLAASYWDPWAILNINNPVGDDDETVSVNREVIPPLSTPVTFYLTPRS